MPTPNMGENSDQFVNRCMSDGQMISEFPDQRQRFAVCQAKFDNKSRSKLEFEMKAVPEFEIKDLDTSKRTAVIAHAVYDVVDKSHDISRKGMFNKSWKEAKSRGIERSIGFYINHDPERQPGLVKDVWETENKAYTKVWFGNHTLGNDTMIMMDDRIIRDASFGFNTLQKNFKEIKGKKIRELKEVLHGETSVVYGLEPVNDLAGVVSVTKAGESELLELKSRLEEMESFCRSTNASDDCIKTLLHQIAEIKGIISRNDTANTRDDEPSASVKEFSNALHLLKLKI